MGKSILLLTGWGATCTVWEPIIPALSECFQINSVTPPWVKKNQLDASLKDLNQYIDKLASSVERPVNIVAWSLGGLLAVRLASRYPDIVCSIHFVSSVPKFVSEDNQHAGIGYDWFIGFIQEFKQKPLSALKKFLVLQAKNDVFAKSTLSFLKKTCRFDKYDLDECRYGLDLLHQMDLMEELVNLQCETVFMHGDRDAVVDIEVARYAAIQSGSDFHAINGAGHIPHVSHPQQVIDIVKRNF